MGERNNFGREKCKNNVNGVINTLIDLIFSVINTLR